MTSLFALIAGLGFAGVGAWLSHRWASGGLLSRETARLSVESLAAMRWREGLTLLLESLAQEGYRADAGETTQGNESNAERQLMHDGERVILWYKPGIAYAIHDTVVNDLIKRMRTDGANRGIIATLGSIDSAAHALAHANNVRLIDGAHVWARVEPLLPASQRLDVVERAQVAVAKPRRIAMGASLAIGALIAGLGGMLDGRQPELGKLAASVAQTTAAAPAVPTQQGNTTAGVDAAASVVRSVEQLASRRAELAENLRTDPTVRTAAWSSESTLEISLQPAIDVDSRLPALCEIVLGYEELASTRLQFNPARASDPVRWRNCR